MSLSLQDEIESASKRQSQRSSRRHLTKDLVDDVELIKSQEYDSEMEMGKLKKNYLPVTPKAHKEIDDQQHSPLVGRKDTSTQTPRRSTRKSIKPVQEYEDIVSRKRQLRSVSNFEAENIADTDEKPQSKWTPAKVGRVSQKRSRKHRKSTKGDKNKSKIISSSETEDTENEKDNLKTSKTSEEDLLSQGLVEAVESEDVADKNAESDINKITNESSVIDLANEHLETQLQKDVINLKETVKDEAYNDKNSKEIIEEAKSDNGFGTYLKNNTLDIYELGINPLSEENDEKVVGETNSEQKIANALNESFSKTGVVMEIENTEITAATKNDYNYKSENQQKLEVSYITKTCETEVDDTEDLVVTIKDDTFNSSDCVLVNNDVADDLGDDMQPLRLSDEESSTSPPRKAPRIILTNDVGQEQMLNCSVPSNVGVTPKRHSKTTERKPTPFKPKTTVLHSEDEEECDEDTPSIEIEVTKMEPKEIVLRSIRKRSFSVCVGGTEADNRRKNVTFYSPANQTTILEDLDLRIVQSVKKDNGAKPSGLEPFVTRRRKRSLSFDEALANKSKYRNQTPSKIGEIPQKAKPARTKLPNFAAIHQKHFEKMENLVDHVNRKAERAKILTNSATKQRSASAQKTARIQQVTSTTTTGALKPKAVKRIDLPVSSNSTFCQISNTSLYKAVDATRKNLNNSKLPIPQIGVCKPISSTETAHKENHEVNLPNPRLGIIKPHTITNVSSKNKQLTPAKNALKTAQTRQAPRPAFNLSTALELHSCNTNSDVATTSIVRTHTKATSAPPATITIDEKMAKRRQRHMDMFKGRGGNARTTPGTAEKNYGQLIRGVRSNRRFELQMAHRKNMEH